METHYYSINGVRVARYEDIWSIPALLPDPMVDGGRIGGTLHMRITEDGRAADERTSGPSDRVPPEYLWEIRSHEGRTAGWCSMSSARNYEVGGALVRADVLEQIARWTGLSLPQTA